MGQLPRPLHDPTPKIAVGVPVPIPWYRLAGARIAAQWLLKFTASVAFMAAFFAGYFLLLKFPVFHAIAMPVLAVDRWIPFQPGALWVYVSLWVYVQLAPALLPQRSEVLAYGAALLGMTAIGFTLFFFFPTTLGLSSIDWTQHAAFQTLKEVDASGNACPSLHVAFAIFTALSLSRSLRQIDAPFVMRVTNAVWCLAIIYSTLATRQHVFLDVVGGAFLAWVVWRVYVGYEISRAIRSSPRT